MHADPRATCLRCRRAASVCVCAEMHPVRSRMQVVFVQHPREARMPVSTCRLAHLSLPGSEMYVALGPEGVPALEARVRAPGTMVLFPGPGSVDVEVLSVPPEALVVVDGTWINARKLVERSPLLSALPRLGFSPPRPTNYRIRREPAAHCLSTIEAVAYVLEVLEGAPGRYTPMLGSFTRMVDLQLAHVASGVNTRRHAPRRSLVQPVRELGERLVLVFAEGSVWPADQHRPTEVLHWVALRPATGERFEARLRPRSPLAPYTERCLGIRVTEDGETLASAIGRWEQFLRPGDTVATWGRYSFDVLRGDGVPLPETLDLRRLVSNVLQSRVGGVEHLAEGHGQGELPEGRMPRLLRALDAVTRALLAGELRSPRAK